MEIERFVTGDTFLPNAEFLSKFVCIQLYRVVVLTDEQTKAKRNLITLRAKLSGAVYCYRSCLCGCVCNGRAGGVRTLLQPARARSVCVSERFFHWRICNKPDR